jgi:hypothetical protein
VEHGLRQAAELVDTLRRRLEWLPAATMQSETEPGSWVKGLSRRDNKPPLDRDHVGFRRCALRRGRVPIGTFMGLIRSIHLAMLGSALLLPLGGVQAEPVPVRYAEGVARGFIVMRTLQGEEVADGDLSQVVRGDRVSRRLVFHFKDGSIQDESVVFSQRGPFRLLSDRLIQKGPAFPHPIDMTIDGVSGHVKVRYADDDGKEKLANERMALPADVPNGLLLTLLRNLPRDAPSITVSIATGDARAAASEVRGQPRARGHVLDREPQA